MSKCVKRPIIWYFRPEKGPLERFIQTCLLAVYSYHSWASLCQNRETVTEQFWSKWPPSAKRANFDISDLEKWPLRDIQPNLSFDMWFMSSQRSSIPKQKVTETFLRLNPPPPLNLDGRMDRWTTDNSASQKLRCLSAGRPNNRERDS